MNLQKVIARSILIFVIVLLVLMMLGVYQGMQVVGSVEDPLQKLSLAANWCTDNYPIFWLFLPFAMIAPAIYLRHSSALSDQ